MARISRRGASQSTARPQDLTHLRSEHADLESRLHSLDAQVYLTHQERMERKRIQKQKLILKDRMYALQRVMR